MKQTWRLIGRSVDTYFLIAHWEFPILLVACLGVCFYWGHWHVDYDACLSWLRIPIVVIFSRASLLLFVRDIDMLFMLIDHLTLLSIVTLIFAMFCSDHFTCIDSTLYIIWFDMIVSFGLYIILIIIEHATICQIFFSISLCVDLDDIYLFCMIVCCMTSLVPCDCMSCLSMWDTHLSPYSQDPSLGRHCFPGSRIWYETCLLCLLFDRASD